MAYNFTKTTCDKCGVHQDKAPKIAVSYANGTNGFTNSFRLGYDGSVHCAGCHQENALASLFAAMDAREGRHAA